MDASWKKLILIFFVFFAGIFTLIIWHEVYTQGERELTVSFLDVGQGDAIFIETPSGKQLLVDGGPNLSVLRSLGRKMRFYDRNIDIVLPTHADADHVGGLPEIYRRFKVAYSALPAVGGESVAYQALIKAVEDERSEFTKLYRGQVVDFGDGVIMEVLFPPREAVGMGTNESSLVARLVYGDVVFLLTGDASDQAENYLALLEGGELEANVLKVGHHGSNTSSSAPFLSAASPEYAIISAGCGNRYGHPHEEVLERLEAVEAEVLSTCEEGTITFVSDGQDVILK